MHMSNASTVFAHEITVINVLVDVRVAVSADLSIQQGHDVCKQIKKSIIAMDDEVTEVLVHLNPWYEEDQHISKTEIHFH